MFCNQCGQANPDGSRFCSSCGAELKKASAPEAAQPQGSGKTRAPAQGAGGQAAGVKPTGMVPKAGQPPSLLQPDTVVGDRYHVRRLAGRGALGEVYEARDSVLNETVALKVLRRDPAPSAESDQAFLREAGKTVGISHKNIVRVHDVFIVGGLRCVSMEYIDGLNLRQFLERRQAAQKPPSVKEVTSLGIAVCDALQHAHATTLHLDLKPENIFVTRQGQTKVGDFGMANLASHTQSGMAATTVGTAYYLAPEQATGGTADHRADIYSLAAILYQALTGQLPIGRFRNPRELRADVPEMIDRLIMAALETDPGRRPSTLAQLRAALSAKIAETPAPQAPAKPVAQAPPPVTYGLEGEKQAAPRPLKQGRSKTLTGASEQQARQILAEGQIKADRLLTDKAYRDQMTQNALFLVGHARTALNAAGHTQLAKAIEESHLGLLLLIAGWPELAKTNKGLALSILQLNLIGYYLCLTSVVQMFGLGELDGSGEFDEDQFVSSVMDMATSMKNEILGKMVESAKKQQKKPGGFLGKFFS